MPDGEAHACERIAQRGLGRFYFRRPRFDKPDQRPRLAFGEREGGERHPGRASFTHVKLYEAHYFAQTGERVEDVANCLFSGRTPDALENRVELLLQAAVVSVRHRRLVPFGQGREGRRARRGTSLISV